MSSGGTSSVVHTDSSDNIICVYRGQKNFVMVDPSLYADKVSSMLTKSASLHGVTVSRLNWLRIQLHQF